MSYKDDFLYGSIYPNCSTFVINHIENMKAVPDYNIYTTEYSTYSYSRGDYPKEELNMAEFRKALSGSIPRYMLPNEYHREEILKQNSSGKIDRAYYNKLFK